MNVGSVSTEQASIGDDLFIEPIGSVFNESKTLDIPDIIQDNHQDWVFVIKGNYGLGSSGSSSLNDAVVMRINGIDSNVYNYHYRGGDDFIEVTGDDQFKWQTIGFEHRAVSSFHAEIPATVWNRGDEQLRISGYGGDGAISWGGFETIDPDSDNLQEPITNVFIDATSNSRVVIYGVRVNE